MSRIESFVTCLVYIGFGLLILPSFAYEWIFGDDPPDHFHWIFWGLVLIGVGWWVWG